MYHLPASVRPGFLQDPALRSAYRGKRVLVLGGDGFLGSHIATALEILGADVSVLSRRISSPLEGTSIRIHRGHLLQREIVEGCLEGQEMLFDLAGMSGAVDSNRDPRRNLAEECEPHLNAFQIAAECQRPPLVVFCSSRTVYGKPRGIPVSESHPVSPESIYAIHKLTLEHYLRSFGSTHDLGYIVFRLSNPYGPQLESESKSYGILNQFILRALAREPIRLFGDGSQKRDYIHIDDVVEAFVRVAFQPSCRNQVFNLGGPETISIRDAAAAIVQACPGSQVVHEAWPVDYYAVETGDYASDVGKLRQLAGFSPSITFSEGIQRTLLAYRSRGPSVTGRGEETSTARVTDSSPSLGSASSWSWSGRRVLVTGASGFLGSQLVRRLLQLGAQVAAVHRRPLDPAIVANPAVLSLELSVEETERLHREVTHFQPEVIYHLASRPDGAEVSNHAIDGVATNVLSTVGLLEMARMHSVAAFVFAGSAKVFGNSPVPHREYSQVDPQSSYAASKLAAWNYGKIFARLHDVPAVALHPTLIYGVGQGSNLFSFLANAVRSGRTEIELQGGLQTRDPLYIDDAIEAYLRAAVLARHLRGRAIPIGGGREYTVQELAELFLRAAGWDFPVRTCLHRIRRTEMMRSFCDNGDARIALQWLPRVAAPEGLRLTAGYLLGTEARPAG